MSQPSGEQGQQPARSQAKAKVKALDVVEYTHRDPILGHAHQAAGVVVAVGDGDGGPVTIRPLAHYSVQVDPADVAGVVTAGDDV